MGQGEETRLHQGDERGPGPAALGRCAGSNDTKVPGGRLRVAVGARVWTPEWNAAAGSPWIPAFAGMTNIRWPVLGMANRPSSRTKRSGDPELQAAKLIQGSRLPWFDIPLGPRLRGDDEYSSNLEVPFGPLEYSRYLRELCCGT